MRYVPKDKEQAARRAVNFEAVGNISVTGSVRGMQKLFGWPVGGQVRIGSWVYNVGPAAVETLRASRLLRGD